MPNGEAKLEESEFKRWAGLLDPAVPEAVVLVRISSFISLRQFELGVCPCNLVSPEWSSLIGRHLHGLRYLLTCWVVCILQESCLYNGLEETGEETQGLRILLKTLPKGKVKTIKEEKGPESLKKFRLK